MNTFAVGVAHTPWRPERAESMERLRLHLLPSPPDPYYREFTERATCREWSLAMWKWGYEMKADWLLVLQDDALLAPNFWSALEAMVQALPADVPVLGLSATHPAGPEIARQGHRWYATSSLALGWGYAIRHKALGAFLEWQETRPDLVAGITSEDALMNAWVYLTGQRTYHPVPSIVDHDVSVASTYDNDDHSHRRTTVTWHGYSPEAMADPAWWRMNPNDVQLLPWPDQKRCWMCLTRPEIARSNTGVSVCHVCLFETVKSVLDSVIVEDKLEVSARQVGIPARNP